MKYTEALAQKGLPLEELSKSIQKKVKEFTFLKEQIEALQNEDLDETTAEDVKFLSIRLEELDEEISIAITRFDKEKHLKKLQQLQDAKKKSLEARILSGLDILMHKKVIKKVVVEMIDEHINIRILNGKGEEIQKDSLSMGEKQLYATALLKALVEESNISFPVFVDSPMQKFDEDHAENVIKHFYPNISEQVVIFPILKKELTQDEFKMLSKNISKCYLINNKGESESEFLEVANNKLFETYNKRYKDDN